jgi:hypothetical protein
MLAKFADVEIDLEDTEPNDSTRILLQKRLLSPNRRSLSARSFRPVPDS